MKVICIAALSAGLVLPLMATAQNQQNEQTTTTQDHSNMGGGSTTTTRTTTQYGAQMTKEQMKAQRDEQNREIKAASDKVNAMKARFKAQDAAEKAAQGNQQ